MSTPTQEEIAAYLRLREWVVNGQKRIEEIEAEWAAQLPMEFGKPFVFGHHEGQTITAERPLVEEWDQSELARAATELLAAGTDYSSFLQTAYEVDKRALKRQPPEIQKLVDRARIMSGLRKNGEPRKPKFTVE